MPDIELLKGELNENKEDKPQAITLRNVKAIKPTKLESSCWNVYSFTINFEQLH